MASVSTKNWMSTLSNNLTLDKISMPGTHDSGTQKAPPGGARTQNFDISTQLKDGIRFLDIRVKTNGNKQDPLNIYHSYSDCDLTFGTVLKECKSFLSENTDETIVMLINAATSGVRHVQEKFNFYLQEDAFKNLFYLETKIPTLRESRGKIILFRRFSGNLGIDLSKGWKDNATFTLITPEEQVFRIEDQYKEHNTHKKMAAVQSSINSAANAPENGEMYITYNSIAFASHTPYQYAWGGGAGKVSPKMNPGLTKYLKDKCQGSRLGIIVFDFYNNETGNIDNENVRLIINTNHNVSLSGMEAT
ncbi:MULTISPECIES: phosphatidylinositol-specific phospholipase C [Pseudoalteromonas]|uniref:1-phosphatidylinositol phosphodiesterase n=1 Tax=Pseudoalteromonas obscura TaxID=3048491 RepID=A0ABT7EE87_9GAMM|nr:MULTISPECIES: phosphatidylinositol-specific phospholipase C [Pseudoalteromonas]MBQ4838551.1 phosphatidylinositol-specific phospholipase C [Pseudoalteromonas luteoviolacea]MDK2593596.1 phosphatidylinositol-specific phospholipase C [Pseudoalteromonas sp. P94(2023)]